VIFPVSMSQISASGRDRDGDLGQWGELLVFPADFVFAVPMSQASRAHARALARAATHTHPGHWDIWDIGTEGGRP
jgi:hypothetical protein